jgi:nucleoid DNA-binding protein
MHKQRWLALSVLLMTLGLILAFTSPAHSQKPRQPKRDETMHERLARETKLTDDQVTKFLNALGPAIKDELTRGKQVSLPGLGTFRVVRVAEHKDIRDGGRPIVVPAFNTVEFVGEVSLGDAANSATAVPAETVPAFQYVTLPGQTPGQKMGRTHTPSQRVK